MIDLLHDVELDAGCFFTAGRRLSIASNLPTLLVIVPCVWFGGIGKLHMCNLKVVLGLIGGVGTEEQPMGREVLVWVSDAGSARPIASRG
jgi:hypothetical protein